MRNAGHRIWAAIAIAGCALIAPVAVASTPKTKIEYVAATKMLQPRSEDAKTASCPNGFNPIGGGSANPGLTEGPIVGLGLTPRLNWYSQVDNLSSSQSLRIKTIAVCAQGALAQAAQLLFSSAVQIPAHQQGTAVAACPGAETAMGGGVSAISAGAGLRTRVLRRSEPVNSGSAHGWAGALDNLGNKPMTIRTQAICVQPSEASGVRYRVQSKSIAPGTHALRIDCLPGAKVLGGGALGGGAFGEVRLSSSEPAGNVATSPTGWKATFENTSASPQPVTTTAICYRP